MSTETKVFIIGFLSVAVALVAQQLVLEGPRREVAFVSEVDLPTKCRLITEATVMPPYPQGNIGRSRLPDSERLRRALRKRAVQTGADTVVVLESDAFRARGRLYSCW